VIVVVLAFAGIVARSCGSVGRDITQDQAIALAEKEASFEPERHQVRFLQQGIPPRPYWGVSFYDVGPDGRPVKVEVFLVDAHTGEVTPQN
jgi:hypothetical protein